MAEPTDIYKMVGRRAINRAFSRCCLQGLSDTAKQVICALLSSEILKAASSKTDPLRHALSFTKRVIILPRPATAIAVSHRIIKRSLVKVVNLVLDLAL